MVSKIFFAAALSLALSVPALAQAQNPRPTPPQPPQQSGTPAGACIYNNIVFSDGAYICVSGKRWQACNSGKWGEQSVNDACGKGIAD